MRPSTFPLIALSFVLVPIPVFAAGTPSIDSESSNHGTALRYNEELRGTQDRFTRELSFGRWGSEPDVIEPFPVQNNAVTPSINSDSSNHGTAVSLDSEEFNADNEELRETQDQLRRQLSFGHWASELDPIQPFSVQNSAVMPHLMTHINIVEKVILEVAEALNDCKVKGVLSRAISNAGAGRAVGRAFCNLINISDTKFVRTNELLKVDDYLRRPLLELAKDYGRALNRKSDVSYELDMRWPLLDIVEDYDRVPNINKDVDATSTSASKSDELRKHLKPWMSNIRDMVVRIFPKSKKVLVSPLSKWSNIMGRFRRNVDVTERVASWLTLLAQVMRKELTKMHQNQKLDSQQWTKLLTSVHETLSTLMQDTIQIRSQNMHKYDAHYKLLLLVLRDEHVSTEDISADHFLTLERMD